MTPAHEIVRKSPASEYIQRSMSLTLALAPDMKEISRNQKASKLIRFGWNMASSVNSGRYGSLVYFQYSSYVSLPPRSPFTLLGALRSIHHHQRNRIGGTNINLDASSACLHRKCRLILSLPLLNRQDWVFHSRHYLLHR
jgi:hypothetical protein